METFTPTPTLAASYSAPQDGVDVVSVTTVRPWLEGLSNLGAYVRTLIRPLSAVSFTRCVQAFGAGPAGPVIVGLLNNQLPPGGTFRMPLGELPTGATITGLRVRINPADDTLPTTRFSMDLIRRDVDTVDETILGSVVDPATGAAYQAIHNVSLAVSHEVKHGDGQYYAKLYGEAGGDTDDISVLEFAVTYTVIQIDLGR